MRTVGHDNRFHQVVDAYDRAERRRVRRQVLDGNPSVGTRLETPARAYAEHLGWTLGAAKPQRQFRISLVVGAVLILLGVLDQFTSRVAGGGLVLVGLGIAQVALAVSVRRQTRRQLDGLRRSRSLLGLPPLDQDIRDIESR